MTDSSLNVLVVDDAPSVREILKFFLNELGINKITECETGLDALNTVKESKTEIDLIFVDLNMPVMDGMELIRHLGAEEFKGGIIIASEMEPRVINLASNAAKNHKVHLIGNLSKPIDRAKLAHALDKFYTFQQRIKSSATQLTKEDIELALKEDRFIPYYQPKVDTRENQLHSMEVLARIDAPGKGGTIPPSQFINCAENNDLINLITYQILEKALVDFKEMRKEIESPFTLAFNLSPLQLNDLTTIDTFQKIFDKHDIKPSDIVVEVTEEYAVKSANQLETLNRFRI